MSLKKGHVLLAVLAAILAAVAGAAIKIAADPSSAATSASNSTTFSGRATGISGKVAGIPVGPIVDATIAPEGGVASSCLTAYPGGANCLVPTTIVGDQTGGAVYAEVLSARVVGHGKKSRASFSLVDLSVNLCKLLNQPATCTLPTVTSDVLAAEANAVCENGVATLSGGSVPLVLDGLPAPVEEPIEDAFGNVIGSRLVIPVEVAGVRVATIYLNEQTRTGSPSGHYQLDVNALRIESTVLNTNLIIGHVEADITCGSNPGSCPDAKLTGGGWYQWLPGSGNKVHFALSARQDDQTWGHLMYQDRNAPLGSLKFHGQPDFALLVGTGNSITSTDYSLPLSSVTIAEGAAVVSGTNKHSFTYNNASYAPGTARFIAVAIDNGEGNKALLGDVFAVVIVAADGTKIYESNAVVSAGVLGSLFDPLVRLGGGNVQYHACKK